MSIFSIFKKRKGGFKAGFAHFNPRYHSKHFRRGSTKSRGKFLTQGQISRRFPLMSQGFKSGQGF